MGRNTTRSSPGGRRPRPRVDRGRPQFASYGYPALVPKFNLGTRGENVDFTVKLDNLAYNLTMGEG
jgi:hypothetical protein